MSSARIIEFLNKQIHFFQFLLTPLSLGAAKRILQDFVRKLEGNMRRIINPLSIAPWPRIWQSRLDYRTNCKRNKGSFDVKSEPTDFRVSVFAFCLIVVSKKVPAFPSPHNQGRNFVIMGKLHKFVEP